MPPYYISVMPQSLQEEIRHKLPETCSKSEDDIRPEITTRVKNFAQYDDDILNSRLKEKIDKWLKDIGA